MEIKKIIRIALVLLIAVSLTGCSVVLQKRYSRDVQRIRELKEEARALADTKRILEERLKKEIGDEEVRLELAERGLVITFIDKVLFDSGKAELRKEAHSTLDKVASVLAKELKERNLGIEGHTDNEPIKYSGWKSNWQLSAARATSVLHYLVDKKGVSPKQVSATGFGEYRPVASNETPEGREKNRRVEIIIIPGRVERIDLEELYQEEAEIRYRK